MSKCLAAVTCTCTQKTAVVHMLLDSVGAVLHYKVGHSTPVRARSTARQASAESWKCTVAASELRLCLQIESRAWERVMASEKLQHLSRCHLPPERDLTQHSALQLARVLQLALQRVAGANQHSALVVGKLAAAAQAQRTYIASLRVCIAAASQAPESDVEDAHTGAGSAAASDGVAGLLAMLAGLRGSEGGATHDAAPADVAHQHRHQVPDCAVNSVDELFVACAAQEAAYSAALAAVQAAQQALRDQV